MATVWIHGGTGGRERSVGHAMGESSDVTRVEYDNGDLNVGLDKFKGSKEKPFVFIGPEAPLVAGVSDYLRGEGYTVFGASKAAAQYEASKALAVRMMRKAGIQHPESFIVNVRRSPQVAREYVAGHDHRQYVIKADGLAGGKGVVLPSSREEAREVIEDMMSGRNKTYGDAGKNTIIFQRRKKGPEVSAIAIVGAGKDDYVILPLSQDHKRLWDGDIGPNTGGTGAYASVPKHIVNDAQNIKIDEKAYASLEGIEKDGVEVSGLALYQGLMMSEDLPQSEYVFQQDDSDELEYNLRLGDPETQPQMALLLRAGVDVYRLFRSAAEGSLEKPNVDMRNLGYHALTVCCSAWGYPVQPISGDIIYGLDNEYEDVLVHYAGMKEIDGQWVTSGGRVLYVTGVGETIDVAAERAYRAIGQNAIHFNGMQYRRDIGHQARRAA